MADVTPQAIGPDNEIVPAKAEMSQWDIIRSHPSIIAGGILLGALIAGIQWWGLRSDIRDVDGRIRVAQREVDVRQLENAQIAPVD